MRTDQEVAQRHSRAIAPGETNLMKNPRLLEELKAKRDEHNRIATAALNGDPPNYEVVNPNQAMATLYHDAITTLEKLIDQNGLLTEALKNRLIVALAEAKTPVWKPTHRHYKGTLYRVTGVRFDADHEELIEMVEYDDEKGGKFVLTRRRWESTLDSGRPRYEFLYSGEGAKAEEAAASTVSHTIASIEATAKLRVQRTGMDRNAALEDAAKAAGFADFADAVIRLGSPVNES